jgi:hypothetical protein
VDALDDDDDDDDVEEDGVEEDPVSGAELWLEVEAEDGVDILVVITVAAEIVILGASVIVEPSLSVRLATSVSEGLVSACDCEITIVGAAVVAVLSAAPNPGKYDGVTVSVPLYPAHPGWVVLGGARPPPQSRKEQISPVPGTYQM